MKPIYEYEISFMAQSTRGRSRKYIVQQSAFSYGDAIKRIRDWARERGMKGVSKFKMVNKLEYPHGDGGLKIGGR